MENMITLTTPQDESVKPVLNPNSAGIDLCFSGNVMFLNKDQVYSIPTQSIYIPVGYHGIIYMRSSIAKKYSAYSLGGVIDECYKEKITVMMFGKFRSSPLKLEKGARLAQIVLYKNIHFTVLPIPRKLFNEQFERGGFGSTNMTINVTYEKASADPTRVIQTRSRSKTVRELLGDVDVSMKECEKNEEKIRELGDQLEQTIASKEEWAREYDNHKASHDDAEKADDVKKEEVEHIYDEIDDVVPLEKVDQKLETIDKFMANRNKSFCDMDDVRPDPAKVAACYAYIEAERERRAALEKSYARKAFDAIREKIRAQGVHCSDTDED